MSVAGIDDSAEALDDCAPPDGEAILQRLARIEDQIGRLFSRVEVTHQEVLRLLEELKRLRGGPP